VTLLDWCRRNRAHEGMAKDPYKYFRVEARELLASLTQGVLELEKGGSVSEVTARLLRLAHTLKGAARVVKQPAIAERAHAVEDLLSAQRASGQAFSTQHGSELLRKLDEMGALLRAIEAPSPDHARAAAQSPADEALETVRVEIHEMDSLLRGVTDAVVQASATRGELAVIGRLRELSRSLTDQLAPRPGELDQGSPYLRRARSVAEELSAELERFARELTTDIMYMMDVGRDAGALVMAGVSESASPPEEDL
jgi:two-component system chemotaxis sensor kinase CheA